MPELRKDPVIGRWVIISTERSFRPLTHRCDAPSPDELRRHEAMCPFCEGHESRTPPEILAHRASGPANGPGWRIRVIPNKFPVLRVEGSLERYGDGMYDRMDGLGAHEVVVETPAHGRRLSEMSVEELTLVLGAWHDRIVDLHRDLRLQYVLVYHNEPPGADMAGTHPHSQLIALPIVPRRVADELAGARRYYEFKERCVFCDMVRQELAEGRRLVYENTRFVVIQPYAPRFPFETWLLPKRHQASYHGAGGVPWRELAQALLVAVHKLDHALEKPAYSLILHNSPRVVDHPDHFHWHIEIVPQISRVSGFEWGSGFYINPTAPEQSARFLREETGLPE